MTASKIKLVSNETAIKYIEEDIVRIEQQIKELEAAKAKKASHKPIDWRLLKARVRYLAEHFDELLFKQIDPVKKAQFFVALFDKLPTFEDLKSGTPGQPTFYRDKSDIFTCQITNCPYGTPEGIRTPGLRYRKPTLYPAELRAHNNLSTSYQKTRANQTINLCSLSLGVVNSFLIRRQSS